MNRKSLNRLLLSLLALCAVIYGGLVLANEFRESRLPGQTPAAAALPKIEELGNPQAGLHVELYVPVLVDCHAKTLELVKKFVADHPRQVRLTLLPKGTPEADSKMAARGITCATVLVNGEKSFVLKQNGKSRGVTFDGQPNVAGGSYNSEDVIRVLEEKLRGSK
jgi:hypothetical protein